jgi:tripartite-type tricarboxylate transporter receptor subunit TctC
MKMLRRKFLRLGAIGAALVTLSHAATAQSYPTRPITIIVPYPPGGPTDTISRLVAEHMRQVLGQAIIIENVGGAGGSVGVGRAARAAPDGYTISAGQWNTHVVNAVIYSLSYDVLQDFEPLALLGTNPGLVVVRRSLPVSDLKELVTWLKANPERATAGTVGPGSPQHIFGVLFQKLTDTRFQFVPYRSVALAMPDLISGQIDLMIDNPTNSLPQLRSGSIKALAVTQSSRLAAAPDIPTVDEAGLAGFYSSNWTAFWMPRGTPKEIIAKLNASVVAALTDASIRARLADLGQEIPLRELQTPEALGAFQKAEIKKWWPLIKAAHIRAE